MGSPGDCKKVTISTLRQMKTEGERITMLTCYDATFARLCDRGGADVLLVSDSLRMVIQDESTTLPVTLEDVIYHTRAVRRGASRAHVVADMPFMSYQSDAQSALRNAGRLLKEGGAESVKLEGGEEICDAIDKMVRAGIPVMGHVGLTPQSVHAMGGFKIQGKDPDSARAILRDARALQDAGAYAIVLEGMPVELARVITAQLSIPTIGIGAGVECDGQVLVIYDLLGMSPDFQPKFVKRYAEEIPRAIAAFKAEVRARPEPPARPAGAVYQVSPPEYVGEMPIRTELFSEPYNPGKPGWSFCEDNKRKCAWTTFASRHPTAPSSLSATEPPSSRPPASWSSPPSRNNMVRTAPVIPLYVTLTFDQLCTLFRGFDRIDYIEFENAINAEGCFVREYCQKAWNMYQKDYLRFCAENPEHGKAVFELAKRKTAS